MKTAHKETETVIIQDLPVEIWHTIFYYICHHDLLSLTLVSKQIHSLAIQSPCLVDLPSSSSSSCTSQPSRRTSDWRRQSLLLGNPFTHNTVTTTYIKPDVSSMKFLQSSNSSTTRVSKITQYQFVHLLQRFQHLHFIRLYNLHILHSSLVDLLSLSSSSSSTFGITHLELHNLRIGTIDNTSDTIDYHHTTGTDEHQHQHEANQHQHDSSHTTNQQNIDTNKTNNTMTTTTTIFNHRLTHLQLSGTILSPYNKFLQPLLLHPILTQNLQHLHLDGCQSLQDDDIHDFTRYFHYSSVPISCLHLSACPNLISPSFYTLPTLKRLEVMDCEQLMYLYVVSTTTTTINKNSATSGRINVGFPNLIHLDLSNCTCLRDDFISSIFYTKNYHYTSTTSTTTNTSSKNIQRYYDILDETQLIVHTNIPHHDEHGNHNHDNLYNNTKNTNINHQQHQVLTNYKYISDKLQILKLNGCKTIQKIFLSSPILQILELSSCSSLVQVELVDCHSLTLFRIESCMKLQYLKIQSSNNIRKLDLSFLVQLHTLILHTPSLQELWLTYNEKLDPLSMVLDCPSLLRANIVGTKVGKSFFKSGVLLKLDDKYVI